MNSCIMSETDVIRVNLSNHAIHFFNGLEDDTIPLQERKVNQDILHRIHFEESELNVINEEIRMVESLFLDEYQYKASPESCSKLKRFLHKKRCNIALSEVRELYHQMKVELGKEDSCSILSQEWNTWFNKHQSDPNMTIPDNSFSMNPSTDLKVTSLSTLHSLRIGNHCFQDFLSFSLSGHPYLTSILIFSDSFTSEEGGAFSIFDCPALKTLEIRSNSFTHFQSFRIYSMLIQINDNMVDVQALQSIIIGGDIDKGEYNFSRVPSLSLISRCQSTTHIFFSVIIFSTHSHSNNHHNHNDVDCDSLTTIKFGCSSFPSIRKLELTSTFISLHL